MVRTSDAASDRKLQLEVRKRILDMIDARREAEGDPFIGKAVEKRILYEEVDLPLRASVDSLRETRTTTRPPEECSSTTGVVDESEPEAQALDLKRCPRVTPEGPVCTGDA
jgi:hypothetical protein